MLTELRFLQKLRRSIHTLGLAFVLALSSCATPPKLNSQKEKRTNLERQTSLIPSKIDAAESRAIREKLNRFNRSLNKKGLSEADWKLHDELLDYYIELKKRGSSTVTIPAKSRLTLPLETYCLNSGKAAPEPKEVYHWQKSAPGIKYYSELLSIRRQNKLTQHDLQELLWNLQNETRWEDYPDKLKVILQKIDSNAASKLPSRVQDQVKSLVTDTVLGLPGVDEALDSYNLIKGKYYDYDDFKRSVERLTSKAHLNDYDDLTKIPETELYSQSVSEGYDSQNVTFYNPTDRPQELDLEKYYLAPGRSDIQRIGINPLVSDDPRLLSDLEKALYADMARLGVGFTPVVNDFADLFELLTGKDFISGNTLAPFERTMSGVGIVVGSGASFRYAKKAIHSPPEFMEDFSKGLAKFSGKKVVFDRSNLDRARDSLVQSSEFYGLAKKAKPISTPFGAARQELSIEAIEGRAKAQSGHALYRVGTKGKNVTGKDAQFWSLEHPSAPGYAKRYGVPEENINNSDFIEMGHLKPGTNFITRSAPGVGKNSGGAVEVVVPERGIILHGHSSK